jgi:hypothetical protein
MDRKEKHEDARWPKKLAPAYMRLRLSPSYRLCRYDQYRNVASEREVPSKEGEKGRETLDEVPLRSETFSSQFSQNNIKNYAKMTQDHLSQRREESITISSASAKANRRCKERRRRAREQSE